MGQGAWSRGHGAGRKKKSAGLRGMASDEWRIKERYRFKILQRRNESPISDFQIQLFRRLSSVLCLLSSGIWLLGAGFSDFDSTEFVAGHIFP
jgi:hypothetical protein